MRKRYLRSCVLTVLHIHNILTVDLIVGTCDGSSMDATVTNGQCLNLEHCYRRHVKPKKQHEIVNLGKAVHALSRISSCRRVVDVGAGQGHLSRLLNFRYHLEVTTVEGASDHRPKAQKFDREVEKDIKRNRSRNIKIPSEGKTEPVLSSSSSQDSAPKHVVALIEPCISPSEFLRRLEISSTSQDCAYTNIVQCKGQTNQNGGSEQPFSEGERSDKKTDKVKASCDQRNTSNSCLECGKVSQHSGLSDVELVSKANTTSQRSDTEFDTLSLTHDKSDTEYDKSDTQCEYDKSGVDYEKMETACDKTRTRPSETECKRQETESFLMTGLHACGDLTPTLLRVFTTCPQAVALTSVSCCYMKATTKSSLPADASFVGYPMSSFLARCQQHSLSYEAREMACHFVDCYHDRLLDNSAALRSHSYRAALQEVIMDKSPTMKHGSIKVSIKNVQERSFQDYASHALRRLGISPDLSVDQLSRAENRLSRWRDVVAFYTLRLSLAPLVETVILLDRLLFLMEQGIPCSLRPVFDPRLSPRNLVIFACKQQ